ncbi:MAG: hypothetical protein ACLUKH_07005 [Flavonifractor plautii]
MANDGTVKLGVEFDTGDIKKEFDNLGKEAKKSAESVGKLSDTFENAEKDADSFGSSLSKLSDTAKGVAIGDLISNGVQTAIGGLTDLAGAIWNLDETTEEYRIAQGKLDTAFEAAGLSSEAAKQSYTEFYKILGDTDTATEASQLLATLAQDESDIATWAEIAAGVYGTFGDALPIEGLIEAANETAKTGEVTGVLADALNWAGISEDEFNAKLSELSTEAQRNQLIADTLSSTYSKAAKSFEENNESVIKARENQVALDEAMAKVGETIADVKNALLEKFAPAISEIGTKIADFISGIDVDSLLDSLGNLVDIFKALAPAIAAVTAAVVIYKGAIAISTLIETVSAALTTLKAVVTGATVAQTGLNTAMNANPIVLVITLIGSLITALLTLWNTNEDFRNAVISFFEDIKNTVADWVDSIVTFFTETIPNAVKTLLDWISQIPSAIFGGGSVEVETATPKAARAAVPVPASVGGGAAPMESGGGEGGISLTASRNRILRTLQNSMPSMEQRVTVATAAMTPSAAYADPFVAHRAYAQTGQQEQGQSAAPQRVKVDIEFKPREAARFLKPRIDEETNRQGMSLVTGG